MNFDEETRRKLNVEMALALIRDLFQKGQISKRTYDAIEKDAKTKIAGSTMS